MCQDWIADPKFGSVARDFLNVRARNALGDQITEQLQKLMQSDGAEAQSLNSTEFAQPAIFMHSAIALNCYFSSIGEESVQNSVLVGHSVGEFAALYAAGSLEFESALHLVVKFLFILNCLFKLF
jgi:[acyl-carrier-protein] S-malonyltransferase